MFSDPVESNRIITLDNDNLPASVPEISCITKENEQVSNVIKSSSKNYLDSSSSESASMCIGTSPVISIASNSVDILPKSSVNSSNNNSILSCEIYDSSDNNCDSSNSIHISQSSQNDSHSDCSLQFTSNPNNVDKNTSN